MEVILSSSQQAACPRNYSVIKLVGKIKLNVIVVSLSLR